MKCPFRKIKRFPKFGGDMEGTREDFATCYEEDCPLYDDGGCLNVEYMRKEVERDG